jgi:hypothetical protein
VTYRPRKCSAAASVAADDDADGRLGDGLEELLQPAIVTASATPART